MRKLITLSLGLALCAQTALAQTPTGTTTSAPAKDTVVAPTTTAPASTPPAAAAAEPEKVKKGSIYVGGGIAMPMSPSEFSDNWSMGYGGGAGLGYKFTPNVEVIVSGFYNLFSSDLPDSFNVTGGDFSSLEVMGNLKYMLGKGGSKLRPYVIGGVGMATVEFSQLETTGGTVVSPDSSETDFVWDLGAGVEISVSPTAAIFIEGFYTSVATSEETSAYVPIRAGLKFTVF